jgi:hypothetical protein
MAGKTDMLTGNTGAFNPPFVPRVYVKEAIRWEYRVLPTGEEPPREDRLNDLGEQGWELVAALPGALYFKRLVDSGE